MALLPTRQAQVAAISHTRRLLFSSSAVGILSLLLVCAAHLPWGVLESEGRIAAFAVLALTSFVWLALPLAALGSLSIHRRMESAWWMLLVVVPIHVGMSISLAVTLAPKRDAYVQSCTSNGLISSCSLRFTSILVGSPMAGAFLPICAVFVLPAIYRCLPHLPQNPRYDHLMDDDVPLGWNDPPAELAPDSSASESEDDDFAGRKGASDGWYALGKKQGGGRRSLRGGVRTQSWSEVRRARQEKQRNGGRGSST